MLALIPIHDQNPTRSRAWVTWSLILLNVLAFLQTPMADTLTGTPSTLAELCQQQAFLDRWAAIPRELTRGDQLGVTVGRPVPGPALCARVPATYDKPVVLSVLFAMFLHGSWVHLLGNMLYLWIFGNNVEDRLGHLRYLLFYLACGYVATYAFAFANPLSTVPMVGASGAIAGVLGGYLVLFPGARVTSLVPFLFFLPARLPAWVVLGSWFLLQWLYAEGAAIAEEAGQVAYLAHVAGFIAGMFLILPLLIGRPPPRRRARSPTYSPRYPPYGY